MEPPVCTLPSFHPYLCTFSERNTAAPPEVVWDIVANSSSETRRRSTMGTLTCRGLFNGRTDRHLLRRCLRFCLFLKGFIITTSSSVTVFIVLRKPFFFLFGSDGYIFLLFPFSYINGPQMSLDGVWDCRGLRPTIFVTDNLTIIPTLCGDRPGFQ